MSDSPTPLKPGSLAPVEPLTSRTADGKLYERPAWVHAQIGRMMALHPSEWLREGRDLQNETLVYLIRRSCDRDSELMGELTLVLSKRIHRLARAWLRSFSKDIAEELILKVEDELFDLVMAQKPSLRSEFLEIAFAEAVKERALKARRAYKRSPAGQRGEVAPGAIDEDGDEIERPIELAPDSRRSPQAIALENAQFDKLRNAMQDPRQFDAVRLHFVEEMPIRSSDPKEMDLMRHFNASEGQVRYLLRAGKKAIRKFLGGAQ
jgi:hypothetical protein